MGSLPENKPKRTNGRRKSILQKGFVTTLGNNTLQGLVDEPIFEEVTTMGAGKSFGELALQKGRSTRAARIVWKSRCEFAWMSKTDYKKVLQKITEKLVNDLIDFFLSIPLFSSWSRIFLAKLMHKIDKKSWIKNQTVIKEGDPITEIYIIQNGEFEVLSKFQQK